MDWSGVIQVSSIAVTAVFTIVLAVATLNLARHTKRLNERESRRDREEDLRRCIALTHEIIGLRKLDSVKDSLDTFNQLLARGKYFHDADTKRDLEAVVALVPDALKKVQLQINDPLIEGLRKLQPRLTQEIIEWQKDLGNYQ